MTICTTEAPGTFTDYETLALRMREREWTVLNFPIWDSGTGHEKHGPLCCTFNGKRVPSVKRIRNDADMGDGFRVAISGVGDKTLIELFLVSVG